MHEFMSGALNSSSGQKVTNRKQAIAIALSEARRAGQSVSPKKKRRKKEHPMVAALRKGY